MEARVGIEPTNRGFAVHGITTLLPSLIIIIPQSYVIPAKAGIHKQIIVFVLDSRFHGNNVNTTNIHTKKQLFLY